MTGTAPPALAEPVGSGRVATNPTLQLRDLGTEPTLSFYGLQGEQSVVIPVPRGLRPAALAASVELPFTLRRQLPFDPPVGSISVLQDERTISRVDVPGADNASIRLPLAGAEVSDDAISVRVRTNLVPPEGYCAADTSNPLRLNGTVVEYAGTERPPATVAEFLPPILQRLEIFLPARPTRAESDAAVRLTASVVAHYGNRPTAVTVARLDGDAPLPPAQPFERQLVVRESAAPAVELKGTTGVPALLVTGPASDLLNQARLLSSGDLVRVALSSKTVVGPLPDSPQLAGNETTLRDIGQSGENATAVANPQVNIALDQTRLGRAAHNLRVHLVGSYTPLPTNLSGQLVVSVNGETINRWPADPGGAIDRWIDVPDRLLQRYTNLGVAIDAAGNTGKCGESQPITLTIDGDSTVSSAGAVPPVPSGFQSIPQAFMPRVEIGITNDAFADTARAATIVAGLQRLSALPIDTSVVSLTDAIASTNPAVLIAANEWTDDGLALPVEASDDTIRLDARDGSGEPVPLTLDRGLRFGSLQTFYTGERTVLVATSNESPSQLDALLTWLNDDPTGWGRLKGSAIIAPPGQEPVTVATDAAPRPKPSLQQGDFTNDWIVGAGVVAAVLLGSGVFYLRTRTQPAS
jgi:Bacterial cellulose synthase subunit